VGGAGASTASDGIMVVQALNGATTSARAFSLNGRVAAGAYEYFLFKGGVSANTTDGLDAPPTGIAMCQDGDA